MNATSTTDLRELIARFRRRRRGLERLARLGRGVWQWAAALLALLLIDALLPWPPELRLAGLIGLGLLAAGLLYRLHLRNQPRELAQLEEARRLEEGLDLKRNELVNALCLEDVARQPELALSPELARRAIGRGHKLIARVEPAEVVRARHILRLWGPLLAVGLAWLVVGLFQPDLISGGLARFFDPWGDHPPFSLTKLALRVLPARPEMGQDAVVEVHAGGLVPAQATLVTYDQAGRPQWRWPMAREGQSTFTRRLQALRQPVTLRIESGGTWTRKVTVVPVPPPLTQETPPSAPASQEAAVTQPAQNAAAVASDQALMAQLAEAARQMAAQARLIQGRMEGLDPQAPPPAWLKPLLKNLDAQLAAFNAQCDAVARHLGAQQDLSPELRQALSQCQAALDKLACRRLGTRPEQGTGLAAGSGAMATGTTGWLGHLVLAAEQDARTLQGRADELARLRQQSPVAAQGGTRPANLPPSVRAQGTTVESVGAGRQTPQVEALMMKVPPQYRDLVGAYFDRLNEEGSQP